MKTIAQILTQLHLTLAIKPNSIEASVSSETTEAVRPLYGDKAVPASDLALVEELFFTRIMLLRLQQFVGENGLFVKKGDTVTDRIHPAYNRIVRSYARYERILRELQKRDAARAAASPQPKPKEETKSSVSNGHPTNGTPRPATPIAASPNNKPVHKHGNGHTTPQGVVAVR